MHAKNITEEIKTLGALLRIPYEALFDRVYGELAASGFPDVRPSHGSVFRYILPEGSRIIELAERAKITKQSMGYLVNSLHEGGYVEFAPDPTDGRAKLVRLTAKGRDALDVMVRISRRAEAEAADAMGPGEMDELRRLLERLADAVRNESGPTPPP